MPMAVVMGDISFGQTVGMLKNAMDGASTAHGVIANNIANVNTPNFRRADVSFKDALAATEATSPDPGELPLPPTAARPLAPDGPQSAEPFAISTTVAGDQQMRL